MELTRKLSSLARLSRSAENWWSRWCWRYTLQGVETASGVIAQSRSRKGPRGRCGASKVHRLAWLARSYCHHIHYHCLFPLETGNITREDDNFHYCPCLLFSFALSAFNKLFKLRACKKCAHKELTQSQSSYWLEY